MRTLAHRFHQLSAGLLLAALVIAPWLMGSLPPSAIDAILALLATACICWIAALVLAPRRLLFNITSMLALLLLIQGWLMTLHPVACFDISTHGFLPLFTAHPAITGSWDATSSFLAMRTATVLFFVFHMTLDHLRSELFRRYLLWTAAFTGASVALAGIAQRLGGNSLLGIQPGTSFGPFAYPGYAGALLLLTFPAAAMLATEACIVRQRPLTAAIAGFLTLAILIGQTCNTARATVAILLLLILLVGLTVWKLLPSTLRAARRTLLGIIMLCAASIVISFFVMPDKWRALPAQFAPHSARRVLWSVIADLAHDAGWFGFGPNTYDILFLTAPRLHELDGLWKFDQHHPGQNVSIWNNANNDLLQATIEWGHVGAILWTGLVIATFVAGVRRIRQESSLSRRLLRLAPLAGLAALTLHSMVDSPFQILAIQLAAVLFAALLWAPPTRDPSAPTLT